jgi:hypothetical protein
VTVEEALSTIKNLLEPSGSNCLLCVARFRAAVIKLASDPLLVSREMPLPPELVENQFAVVNATHRSTTFCDYHEDEVIAIAARGSTWRDELPDQPAFGNSPQYTANDMCAELQSRFWIVTGIKPGRRGVPEFRGVDSVLIARKLEEDHGVKCERSEHAI